MRFETSEKQARIEKNLFFDISLLICDTLISISDTHAGTALNGNCFTLSLQRAGASAGRIPQEHQALMGDMFNAGQTAGLQTGLLQTSHERLSYCYLSLLSPVSSRTTWISSGYLFSESSNK